MIFSVSVLATGLAVLDAYSLAISSFVLGLWLVVFWQPKDKVVAWALVYVNCILVITTFATALLILRDDPGRLVALTAYVALLTLPTFFYWRRDDDPIQGR
jgi:hypothetical protein